MPHRWICLRLLCLLLCLSFATERGACEKHAQASPLAAQDADQPEGLDIYLLIGQSNMAGRATIPQDAAKPLDRVYLLNDKGQWVPAKNPLNLYSTIRKGEGMQKLGPGYSFAKAMTRHDPDVRIGLIVNARGGSKIEQWLGKSKYYGDARERTKAALKQGGTLKGVLWHQGESDSARPDGYLHKLTTLITSLRADLGDTNLPFIAGQIKDAPAINEQIAKLPDTVHHTAFVKSEGLKTTDRWHFDTDSQIELGKRYAKQMIVLQEEQNKQTGEKNSE